MPYATNRSMNLTNVLSQKLFFNGTIPDWAKGANVDSDGLRKVICPPEDTFGYNYLKISTYVNGYSSYQIRVFSGPPAIPATDLKTEFITGSTTEFKQRIAETDAASTSAFKVLTNTPYYTEDLPGQQYNYRVIPVMGEYTRIEFVFNGALDLRSDPATDPTQHLYNKVMMCMNDCPLVLKNTFDH